jgi:RNA processing factor Prp31
MRPKPLVRILRHGEQNVAANISQVAVADPKLSNSIAQLPGLSLKTVSDSSTQDVFRAIRENLTSLLPDLLPAEEAATRLGLAHSLSRHKLRFSPDKVDTMIIQSIASLDVLDKQLNTYAMRVKEWYGWHFPELAKSKFQQCRRPPLHEHVTDYCYSSQRQPCLLARCS